MSNPTQIERGQAALEQMYPTFFDPNLSAIERQAMFIMLAREMARAGELDVAQATEIQYLIEDGTLDLDELV